MAVKHEIKVTVEVEDNGMCASVSLQGKASVRDRLLAGLYLLENAIIDTQKGMGGNNPTANFIGEAINAMIRLNSLDEKPKEDE